MTGFLYLNFMYVITIELNDSRLLCLTTTLIVGIDSSLTRRTCRTLPHVAPNLFDISGARYHKFRFLWLAAQLGIEHAVRLIAAITELHMIGRYSRTHHELGDRVYEARNRMHKGRFT